MGTHSKHSLTLFNSPLILFKFIEFSSRKMGCATSSVNSAHKPTCRGPHQKLTQGEILAPQLVRFLGQARSRELVARWFDRGGSRNPDFGLETLLRVTWGSWATTCPPERYDTLDSPLY